MMLEPQIRPAIQSQFEPDLTLERDLQPLNVERKSKQSQLLRMRFSYFFY